MGLWKTLFGDLDSLEAKIAERKRQARDRNIRRKAIDVVMELGEVKDSSKIKRFEDRVEYPSIYKLGNYQGNPVNITYSYYSTLNVREYRDYGPDGGDCRSLDFEESFRVEILFKGNVCYSERGSSTIENYGHPFYTSDSWKKEQAVRSCFKTNPPTFFWPFPYGSDGDITTYLPGEWEAHLDALYQKIPQARKEKEARLKREQEEKLRAEKEEKIEKAQAEQERKRQEIEDKKKRFGL